jgi:hypothetical protein
VRIVAAALGLPEPTVVVHDRNLVMAGLRTKGGRGRSAAKVTARDAAHLLTAILASAQVKDSVHSVRRYSDTRPHVQTPSGSGFNRMGIKELSDLPAKHSFVDALEALIKAAANGSLQKGREPGRGPLIEVAALTPRTVGDIRIAGIKKGIAASIRYERAKSSGARNTTHPPTREADAGDRKTKKHDLETDLEQYRRITAKTILRIAETLAG